MPIYEYHCSKCDQDFEELIIGGNTQVKCPNCGNQEVQRQMSVFGFKSGDSFTSSSSGASCDSCTTRNCSTCGH
ncbi:MAG: zinc ribbon domain-containing protein [Deltaproteobacteria bacterium]|nr:MAG: zinc ribbon domain-containing protein [Deltaproteobacteria bacterium]